MTRHAREQTLLSPMSGAALVVLDEARRVCPACDRPFISGPDRRITCSDGCRGAYLADWPHEIDDPATSGWDRRSAGNRAGGRIREQIPSPDDSLKTREASGSDRQPGAGTEAEPEAAQLGPWPLPPKLPKNTEAGRAAWRAYWREQAERRRRRAGAKKRVPKPPKPPRPPRIALTPEQRSRRDRERIAAWRTAHPELTKAQNRIATRRARGQEPNADDLALVTAWKARKGPA